MTTRAKGYCDRIKTILGEAAGDRALTRGEYRDVLKEIAGDTVAALDALNSDDEQEDDES